MKLAAKLAPQQLADDSRTRCHGHFRHDEVHKRLDGVRTDIHAARDFLAGQTVDEKTNCLFFTVRKVKLLRDFGDVRGFRRGALDHQCRGYL